MTKISYLGPKNTFSYKAASVIADGFPGLVELVDFPSLDAVSRSVADGSSDFGVMAYYNYLEGLVQECLDLIYEHKLKIVGSHRLPIVLSIGYSTLPDPSDSVYSHPKALAQCSDWLWANLPNAPQVPSSSTVAAAETVRSSGSGYAIADSVALKCSGLDLFAEDIGNRKYSRANFTDFYLVSHNNGVPCDPSKDYLTMVAITPRIDMPGLLAGILHQVSFFGLNNAKIHSRPALDNVPIDGNEPQMFYLEIACHEESVSFRRCIDTLTFNLTPPGEDVEVVRVLGSYERH